MISMLLVLFYPFYYFFQEKIFKNNSIDNPHNGAIQKNE